MVSPYATAQKTEAGHQGAAAVIPVTNPIESTFATVRHRTIRAKGCLSNKTALAMVFKLVEGAQRSWRRLDGQAQLPKLILGVKFADGLEVAARATRQPAIAAA
jgi:putative transposase